MTIGELPSESFGTCLLPSLPEDVFAVISRFLSPSDICNLSFCCKTLYDMVETENIWLAQCEVVKVLPLSEILQWRIGISSYKKLCRFLVEIMKPLAGIWVQQNPQNPDLGNVVYVMSGFLSVVGCRILLHEVGPLGIHEGRGMKAPLSFSPVFEIICGFDGSNKFFLHGRDSEQTCVYPGFVTGIEKSCNVLSLEVEPRREKKLCIENEINREEVSRKVSFWDLAFRDKNYLLELMTSRVGLHAPEPLIGRLFPTLKDDERMLLERRTMLLKMHKFGGNWKHQNLEEEEQLCYNPTPVDIHEMWENLSNNFSYMDDRESIIENRRSFLSAGDTFGLSLKAYYTEMSSSLGWLNMSLNHFSLYKLPIANPMNDQVYAGLWGGTFGWPSGKCTEDETRTGFYLLMLTYEQSEECSSDERLLVGTKILEGTHYVKYPNGSRMFVVNIDTSSSLEPFPFDADGRDFEHSYSGKGISITSCYRFRCPGSKPGSLFMFSKDLLAFVWQETRDVFTLQRLNLEEMLKKGLSLCEPPFPPTDNFTFMDRPYPNMIVESFSFSSE